MSAVILNPTSTLLCECRKPDAHVHPNGDHFCSWCAGFLGNSKHNNITVHLRGVCVCPAKCPAYSHIRRRCK